MSKKASNILQAHNQELRSIFELVSSKVTNRSDHISIIEILPQVSIELGYDFEEAEKYFKPNSAYINQTINMR